MYFWLILGQKCLKVLIDQIAYNNINVKRKQTLMLEYNNINTQHIGY